MGFPGDLAGPNEEIVVRGSPGGGPMAHRSLAERVVREQALVEGAFDAPGRVSVNPGGFLLTDSVRARLWEGANRYCSPEARQWV